MMPVTRLPEEISAYLVFLQNKLDQAKKENDILLDALVELSQYGNVKFAFSGKMLARRKIEEVMQMRSVPTAEEARLSEREQVECILRRALIYAPKMDSDKGCEEVVKKAVRELAGILKLDS